MQRPERITKILKMLSAGRPVKRSTFLERLEISAATFKRDLENLRLHMNIPIEWSREYRAYILNPVHPDGTRKEELPGAWFDRSELLALIAIQQILDQLEPRLLRDVLHPIRERSVAILGKSGIVGEQLQQALARIRVLPMQRRAVDDAVFERIVTALVTRQQLTVVAINRQTAQLTKRNLSPQRIVLYRDNWYLDAWCHLREALRTFSLDTLQNVHVMQAAALEVDSAVLEAHLASSYGIFAGAATQRAVIRFRAQVAGWIAQERWHPEQTIAKQPNGDIELSIPFSNATELARDILKWGADAEVISPKSLREQVAAAARATAEKYL